MGRIEGPIRAGPDDYDGIVELTEECFPRDKELGGMVPRWGHCFRRNRIGNSLVIKDSGKLVAHVGCIEQTVMSGLSEVRVGGVSSVCTKPSHRGRGLMTKLLAHSTSFMKEEGFAVSDLGGDRLRYSRFGWEAAGRGWAFRLNRRSVAAVPAPEGFTVEDFGGTKGEIEATLRLHRSGRAGVVRDPELHGILLNRLGKRVLIARSGEEVDSYVVVDANSEAHAQHPHVGELAGTEDGIHSLALSLLHRGAEDILIPMPWNHPLNARLRGLSAGWAGSGLRMFKILDLKNLLKAFSEELGRRYRDVGFRGERLVTLAMGGEAPVALRFSPDGLSIEDPKAQGLPVHLGVHEMVRFLLGPASNEIGSRLSPRARFLQALLPMDLYIWHNETV